MRGAVLVATAAAIGNMLQGWDNATIAGAVMYIKKEFKLEGDPTTEGLIVAMSLIGATVITTFSGPLSDSIGRRPMMIMSSILYFASGLVMFWAPDVHVLLLARLLDGFGIGLAVTLVPVYISETAPAEIRGLLNTLPQFTGSIGMFLSYCMVFGMSLTKSPSWRMMLGILFMPSLVYLALTVLFLPESPRWLVSKGRMNEAKKVLQALRGREDVAGELALLVEGLGSSGDTSVEEYIIGPASGESSTRKGQIRLYGPEGGQSLIAKPVTGQSTFGIVSRHGSIVNQSMPLIDPVVTLFGSVHEKVPGETGSMRSMLLPNFGSMLNNMAGDQQGKEDHWDMESQKEGDGDASDPEADYEETLKSPLLSRQTSTTVDKDVVSRRGSSIIMRPNAAGETVSATGIGGGWQLMWKRTERVDGTGKKEEGYQRIYLHQDGADAHQHGSSLSVPGGEMQGEGEYIQAAGLVSQSALRIGSFPIGSEVMRPTEKATKGPSWKEIFEPGVKRALFVGMGIQILQQFSGINGVLYYTPQILEQAGVGVLLSNLGLGSASASLLISALTTFLMLPSIGIAMRLMDVAGRRSLLLSTIPVLIISLIVLVIGSLVNMGSVANATISTISVVAYFCCFVMGFGPVPNILCSEIFPTRVRGLCIAICALTFWIGDIIVTYSLPVMLTSIGLGGVFGAYAIICIISWIFVFLKVPETKGMPLEVISDFFAVGAKQPDAADL
ncbi:Monosaccharide-sensing protein 3 [Cucurbita argyrosperma subsp. argyrosperma]|uniref:Monosaccharide-sensing protein 2-like n=2 Tax=Cucurbita TaxID=3660 RepID=A0A6J1GFA1_CUCMO|nr:monosaccharide-sensing protein 2-like [Cucurbita moschata]XP_022950602.1 monosaccharide-sensing protein 2-like [Cucurbita moschata]KAG7034035.1 Monosaccharide-sensing protein 3 [Cucurbita argyrosperma subsp. argyrosperma]